MINRGSGIPIYIQIQEYLINLIKDNQLKPGEIIISENELARKLDVSRLTVRKAYSQLINKGLFYSVQGKGTFVNNNVDINLLSKYENTIERKLNIGVIMPENTYFFTNILKGIEEKATKNNYITSIMFNDCFEKETFAVEKMIENKVDGIIITPYRCNHCHNVENYQKIIDHNIPLVMVGKPPFNIMCDSVYCNDIASSFEGVEYLINKGHKKIALVLNSEGDLVAINERKEGYNEAINKYLPETAKYIIDLQDPAYKDKLSELILGRNKITAIFCIDDIIAFNILDFLYSLEIKVPDMVEILGFNNLSFSETHIVPLSSLSQPKVEMGYSAFELIHMQIHKKLKPSVGTNHIVFKSTLIERMSTSRS